MTKVTVRRVNKERRLKSGDPDPSDLTVDPDQISKKMSLMMLACKSIHSSEEEQKRAI